MRPHATAIDTDFQKTVPKDIGVGIAIEIGIETFLGCSGGHS
jgi:hypothetical protein